MGVARKEYLSYPMANMPPVYEFKYELTKGVRYSGADALYIYPGQYPLTNTPHVWSVLNLWCKLTTDATVANRYIKFTYFSGDVNIQDYMWEYLTAAIAASQTDYLAALTPYVSGSNMASPAAGFVCTPKDSLIFHGGISKQGYLRVSILNGVAGDAFYVWGQFKYLNYELGIPPGGPK